MAIRIQYEKQYMGTLKKQPLNMTAASEMRVCKCPEIGLVSCKPSHLDTEYPDLITPVEA